MATPLLLGHRGVRSAPSSSLRRRSNPTENTIAAFEYALERGCDGFEFDVRYSRDCRSALHHDANIGKLDVAACEWEQLQRHRPELAYLEEVLSRFRGRAYLDIELKVPTNLDNVIGALREHPPQRGYVVSSFLTEVLLQLHESAPDIPLGYICDDPTTAPRWRDLPIAVFIPHHLLVSAALAEELHEGGVQLFAWTVNRREELLRLADWGVDGLISDDPDLLRATFPSPSPVPKNSAFL